MWRTLRTIAREALLGAVGQPSQSRPTPEDRVGKAAQARAWRGKPAEASFWEMSRQLLSEALKAALFQPTGRRRR